MVKPLRITFEKKKALVKIIWRLHPRNLESEALKDDREKLSKRGNHWRMEESMIRKSPLEAIRRILGSGDFCIRKYQE